MIQPLELRDVHQGFTKQADENLLDRFRELSITDRPMSGIPDPQQAAVIAGLMDVIDTEDVNSVLPRLADFTKCFRLTHDYVVSHGRCGRRQPPNLRPFPWKRKKRWNHMADIDSLFNQFLNHPDVVEQPGANREAKAWNINLNGDVPLWERPILQTHDYHNLADGSVRFQTVKFTDAIWPIRRPDSGKPDGWQWGLKGMQPVLYRLTELRDADGDEWVIFVEGEKNVDRLCALGFVATTNPMGSESWRAIYAKEFRGRKVAIIPNNDDAGIGHRDTVANGIYKEAKAVKTLEPLPGVGPKGDVSDWLDDGHTVDDLKHLLAAT